MFTIILRPPGVAFVDRAKTAEAIEMPFGTQTWARPSNIVLEGDRDHPHCGGVRGRGEIFAKIEKVPMKRPLGVAFVDHGKAAEPIETPFGTPATSV